MKVKIRLLREDTSTSMYPVECYEVLGEFVLLDSLRCSATVVANEARVTLALSRDKLVVALVKVGRV